MEKLLSFSFDSIAGGVEHKSQKSAQEFIDRFEKGERAEDWVSMEAEMARKRKELRTVHDGLYKADKAEQRQILRQMGQLRQEIHDLEQEIAQAQNFVHLAKVAEIHGRRAAKVSQSEDDAHEMTRWRYVASSAKLVLEQAEPIFAREQDQMHEAASSSSPLAKVGSSTSQQQHRANSLLRSGGSHMSANTSSSFQRQSSQKSASMLEDGIPSMERMLSTLPEVEGISDDSLLNDSFSETSDVADLLAAPSFLSDGEDPQELRQLVQDDDDDDGGGFHDFTLSCSSGLLAGCDDFGKQF
uniref:Uncharacterized protein n=1 Tax=Entomoneis paludosa TaxID=265537 RepID=A0A7S2VDF7_9STRA|mmetsp:Transcript_17275/g.35786  ORF Transcript_17275/g.35786 Transcript_17275/m.35786 type:complete len:299 (+) Transcript_17275:162-1058(+)|eukprot:CAMPEP_0172450304 /NCGR_PEP_ID=MMETSP1065-20121228/8702_1 /TAXON_ID=265537 /ORGANISM="Amphiprora paludosa, Strain CCMP125" /LENGTH=298 /DNA_ID=CAMNT_0013202083 /DNA_START=102 /DNA_END=998 /DNA_ORIENTATION=+